MRLYIDVGAHLGKSVQKRRFRALDDLIYAFEPNEICREHPQWKANLKTPGVSLDPRAAWIRDGIKNFYINPDRPDSQSSSFFQEKVTGSLDLENPVNVKCVDFSKWLDQHVTEDDHVVVKMDIEGSEYAVLHKMFEDGTIDLVDELMVEFHGSKIGLKDYESIDNMIIQKLQSRLKLKVFDH